MNMETEPARIVGYVAAIISAAIPILARTFGWTDGMADEWETFLLAAAALIPIIIGIETVRSRVWSPASHEAEVEAARKET